MLINLFKFICFIAELAVALGILGLLIFDARISLSFNDPGEIWESLGRGHSMVRVVAIFLPTLAFYTIFWALRPVRPLACAFIMAMKAQSKNHKAVTGAGEEPAEDQK